MEKKLCLDPLTAVPNTECHLVLYHLGFIPTCCSSQATELVWKQEKHVFDLHLSRDDWSMGQAESLKKQRKQKIDTVLEYVIYFWFVPMRGCCQQYIINWWWVKVSFKDSGGISKVIYYKLKVWLLLFIWNLKQIWKFPKDYFLKQHKMIWADLMIQNCWKVSIIHFAVICRNCAYLSISAHLCNKFF